MLMNGHFQFSLKLTLLIASVPFVAVEYQPDYLLTPQFCEIPASRQSEFLAVLSKGSCPIFGINTSSVANLTFHSNYSEVTDYLTFSIISPKRLMSRLTVATMFCNMCATNATKLLCQIWVSSRQFIF